MGGVANVIKTFAGKVINVVKDAAGFVWETIVPAVLTVGLINIVAAPFSIVAQLGLTLVGTGFGKYFPPPLGGLMRGILDTIPILGPATIKAINAVNSVIGDITEKIGVPYVYIGWCSEERCAFKSFNQLTYFPPIPLRPSSGKKKIKILKSTQFLTKCKFIVKVK